VIIDDLDVKSIPIPPYEADTVLIVDSNAVLSSTVAAEGLQVISRWYPQVLELDSSIQNRESLEGSSMQIRRQAAALAGPPEPFCLCITEAREHACLY